ncbi:MAG: recombination-associated protein RdgC [Pontibacterium sp.]
MWFKNVIAYQLTEAFKADAEALEQALQAQVFTPCSHQQQTSQGWVSASNGLADALVHPVQGFMMVAAKTEDKILPSSVVKQLVDEKVEKIELDEGRKVYKKERDQLKDETIIDLLPRAFSKYNTTHALIAPAQGWIFVHASSHNKAESLLNLLRESLKSLPVRLPETNHSPSALMSQWVEKPEDLPQGFTVLDEAEMRDNLVEGGVIRIKGQALHNEEYIAHLEAGKRVVKLAVEWQEQLQFVLNEDLSIKRIKLTEQYQENLAHEEQEEALAQFDADLVQMGLEYSRLLPALLTALGGSVERV